MSYMGLTQKQGRFDEKWLQNVAFVMLLRKMRHCVVGGDGHAGVNFDAKLTTGCLVFKELVAGAINKLPLHYKGKWCALLGGEMRIFRHL